jgi:hypothetical protein
LGRNDDSRVHPGPSLYRTVAEPDEHDQAPTDQAADTSPCVGTYPPTNLAPPSRSVITVLRRDISEPPPGNEECLCRDVLGL